MFKYFAKLFGSKHERDIKIILPLVDHINTEYEKLAACSDDELRVKTQEFRQKIKDETDEYEKHLNELRERLKLDIPHEEREEVLAEIQDVEKELYELTQNILNDILPQAFAVVKETCRRLLGQSWDVAGTKMIWDMVPFDVQLIGGVVLHQGKIAEMATGEGKTLVATLPTYLNALPGKGVHIVTVNDYLARRDSEWMGKIFDFHGLTVGCIQSQMDPHQRRHHYDCDITYGTNNEFGFDYLRDNMVIDPDELVQRGHNYTIVDEVDSVLIDEARTPLIISGPVTQEDHKFNEMNPRVERLVNAQRSLVSKIVNEAEQLLSQGKEKDAGVQLLRAHRGLPKHNRLLKVFAEPSNKKLMQDTEGDYLREQERRMHEIDDELYFSIDERNHTINLTEKGREYLATSEDKDFFVLPDLGTEVSVIEHDDSLTSEQKLEKKDTLNRLYAERSERIHTVTQLLRAYALYEKDDEYVVTDDGKIMIVDEFTGRLLQGRRYSDGLHQAIEAKEGVKVERDMQTLATITLQNYFRLYKKIAGMTGTAITEASEFFDIYKLDVVLIPTNKPVVRLDENDFVYKTKREKYNAVIEEIENLRKKGQPVLVGTTSVDVSETLSRMLKRKGIPHNVLNAKQHQHEAQVIAYAGLQGSVTIATNMAGRGTDIKLGPGVREVGGLQIVGTERHEARRIDRQLRGRSGRQGDPGASRFYLSLEDDLMRLFGSERIASIMERLGLKEGEVIQHGMITRSIERAQKKVEENNFGIRKRLLEYDNVMNQQREVVYARRRHALMGERLKDEILDMASEWINSTVDKYYTDGEIEALCDGVRTMILVDVGMTPEEFQKLGPDGVSKKIFTAAEDFYKRKEERIGSEMMANLERMVTLQVIDERWKEHLREMDDLKEGINLRAYGQKDPVLEYKGEAFNMFAQMIEMINNEVLGMVYKLFPAAPEQVQIRRPSQTPRQMMMTHEEGLGLGYQGNRAPAPSENVEGRPKAGKQQPIRVEQKIGRNDPCPCGSGKKFKNCHGK
jgi:preprotein translocase subunit SecA